MSFVHLHAHSHYSLLDGLSKVPELIAKAKALGMPAVALTDHGVMYGLVEFYQEARRAGIKPILGVEAYVARNKHTDKRPNVDARPHHLILLAKNQTGYKNLIKLTTIAHLDGFYYRPRIDHELLERYHEGIICLSACVNGEVASQIISGDLKKAEEIARWYLALFGEGNYFLEVQHHPSLSQQALANQGVFELAKKLSIPVVATCDSHYLNREDDYAQDVMLCIQTKKTLADTDRMSYIGEDFSLRSPEDMAVVWADHPDVISNTLEVAQRCELEIELGKIMLPAYGLPPKTTADELLLTLCQEGLERRYGKEKNRKDLAERLAYELDVIKKTGFAPYFLIVQDFINWAKDRGIVVGPGRGSAPGSLVAYLLRITNIDPLAYDLIFERFLNPERISMPDIDTDFADHRRDEVLEYVAQKYGADHVAQIITFGTMAARAAIRDVGRVLGLPYAYCDRVAKLIPMHMTLDQALQVVPELQEVQSEPDGRRLLTVAKRLEGCVRHASTHACGVVITPVAMQEIVPRQRSSADESEIITQYEMHAVEELGLLKMDFLGLKNLTIIEHTLELLKEVRNLTIDIDSLPLNDGPTFQLFQRAETTGVFQLESSGMRRYLKQLRPTELEDIIVMVALYRPGPMELIPDYIAAKHGKKQITYLTPELEPILQKTYGIAIYQEQIMEIARKLGGFSYSEADVLRKAVGKKIAKLLHQQEEKMVKGMIKNGLKPAIAKKIWDYILPFARYGFNRSHAACYALIAYQTAYLKANYPAEFMASLLTSDHGNTDRIAIEVEECRQMGLEVLAPDINESFSTFTVVYGQQATASSQTGNKLRFGLSAIKNLGENVIREIIQERKQNGAFSAVEDFLSRVKTKDLNKKSLEALIKSGCLDRLGERNQLLYNIDKLLVFVKNINEEAESRQSSLFGMLATESVLPRLQLDSIEVATDKQKLKWEKELLGLYVTSHPMHEFAKQLSGLVTPISDIVLEEVGQDKSFLVAGIITQVKRVITKSGEPMAFARIEDVTNGLEVLVFPKTLRENPSLWEEDTVLAMHCRRSDKEGEIKLICNLARPIDVQSARTAIQELLAALGQGPRPSLVAPPRPPAEPTGNVFIHLPGLFDARTSARLKEILQAHPGSFRACLIVRGQGGDQKIATQFFINADTETRGAVESLTGKDTFQVQR